MVPCDNLGVNVKVIFGCWATFIGVRAFYHLLLTLRNYSPFPFPSLLKNVNIIASQGAASRENTFSGMWEQRHALIRPCHTV